MKLVFLVQCHQLSNALLYTVLKLQRTPEVKVFLHVDLKSDISQFNELFGFDNVIFISDRVDVTWGGFSQIRVALNLMNEIRFSDYDYVSFISGDDVFYQSVNNFQSFLKLHNGMEFIGFERASDGSFPDYSQRVKYKFPSFFLKKRPNLFNRLIKKIYLETLPVNSWARKKDLSIDKYYKGSNWFTITKELSSYILKLAEVDNSLLATFQNSYCADELFFQSIVMNSDFKNSIYGLRTDQWDDNIMSLRVIDWQTGPEFPKVFSLSDISRKLPNDCFFLRKIRCDISVDHLIQRFGF
ncbi:beta-1,6-N-acetylglucosaminyltransferase [Paraglaciecola agarilytica]|uniref:beta-1,6-N-acetylglucosaminyltransferase n=1 Tax=Paraglaciecola chathamensis TaxID=368405 RepID=UPI001C09BE6E|nr:beta-1,6-N-acetylglucosaminyltransferase [Paraglaciecola agarilytica]MBU3016148.1 beta-1,6-N-acetylglucosaminyltransferase [Paraglaciecola agarilytica]